MRVGLNEAQDGGERIEARGEFLDIGLAVDAGVAAGSMPTAARN
jgi:hypothetical protein